MEMVSVMSGAQLWPRTSEASCSLWFLREMPLEIAWFSCWSRLGHIWSLSEVWDSGSL